MAVTRDATVVWEGGINAGQGTIVDTTSGALNNQQITWASRFNEPGGQSSPEELIAAAHATCVAMALTKNLTDAGNDPTRVDVSCSISLGNGAITSSALTIEGVVPGIDEASFQEIVRQTVEGCPVSGALSALDISATATLVATV